MAAQQGGVMRGLIAMMLALALSAVPGHGDVPRVHTVFIIGDSTASEYSADRFPRHGWGMRLADKLPSTWRVSNHAQSGRSSRSFRNEGHFVAVRDALGAGDLLLIQFGHNDQKPDVERHTDAATTYRDNLAYYVNEALAAGARPVLLTSIPRYAFDADGLPEQTLGDYPQAVRDIGQVLEVPVIDLNRCMTAQLRRLGPERARAVYLFLAPGEYPAYPDGVADGTHLSEFGADWVAVQVVESLAPYLEIDHQAEQPALHICSSTA